MTLTSFLRRALLCFFVLLAVSPPERTRPPVPIPTLGCVHEGNRLASTPCPDPVGEVRFYGPRVRRALGEPVCWWTAPAHRLTDLPSVGPALAEVLAQHRDAGGRPDAHALDALPGIGPERAAAIADALDVNCQGPRTRRGFRRTHRVQ